MSGRMKVLTPGAEVILRRRFDRRVSRTYAPNWRVHEGLFEAAYFEGMEEAMLDLLAEVEEATGVQFDFAVKNTRVRVGYAGAYL